MWDSGLAVNTPGPGFTKGHEFCVLRFILKSKTCLKLEVCSLTSVCIYSWFQTGLRSQFVFTQAFRLGSGLSLYLLKLSSF